MASLICQGLQVGCQEPFPVDFMDTVFFFNFRAGSISDMSPGTELQEPCLTEILFLMSNTRLFSLGSHEILISETYEMITVIYSFAHLCRL